MITKVRPQKLLQLIIMIGLFTSAFWLQTKQAHAETAMGSNSGCDIYLTPPIKTGARIGSVARIKCDGIGKYLPYAEVCIARKGWFGRLEFLACDSDGNGFMAGYLGYTDRMDVYYTPRGEGEYFTVLRWQYLSASDVVKYIRNPGGFGNIRNIFTGKWGSYQYAVWPVPYYHYGR